MSDSSFDKFSISALPTSPGQIATNTLTATLGTFGSCVIHWQQVGKLYCNIWISTAGGLQIFFFDDSDTWAQVASVMGITVNTRYVGQNYGAYTGNYIIAFSTWNANPPANNTRGIILGFLTT